MSFFERGRNEKAEVNRINEQNEIFTSNLILKWWDLSGDVIDH